MPGHRPFTFTTTAVARWGLALLCTAFLQSAAAWGPQGHRVAGMIAEQHLSPQARKAIDTLLGEETLASASTWADRMRSDPSPFWQETAGAYHYVKVTSGRGYQPGDAPPQGDAYSALADFARDLTSVAVSAERQRLALRFSIHIVQDLQQPLHAGERDDRGGNDVKVTFAGRPSNLHRVWDSGLLSTADRSDREWVSYLSATYTDAGGSTWRDADPLTWIGESARLSRSVYPDSAVLDSRYIRRHLETAERRLAQAGIRTAVYLNRLFEQHPGVAQTSSEPAPRPASTLWQRLKNVLKEIVQ